MTPTMTRRALPALAGALLVVALLAACSSSSTTATTATTTGTVPTKAAKPYVLRVGFINPKGNTWYARRATRWPTATSTRSWPPRG